MDKINLMSQQLCKVKLPGRNMVCSFEFVYFLTFINSK